MRKPTPEQSDDLADDPQDWAEATRRACLYIALGYSIWRVTEITGCPLDITLRLKDRYGQ